MLFRFFVLASLFFVSCSSPGEEVLQTKLSADDTLRIERYLYEAGEVPVFSMKRQLYIDSVLMIIPESPFLWQQKAMPLLKQRKYELALPFLDSAVKYDNANNDFIEYRAFVKCIFLKSYKEALADFDAAQQLNGNAVVMDHRYSFYRGLSHLQLNEIDTAIHFFNQTLEQSLAEWGNDGYHFLYPFYLGIAHFEKEEYSIAIEYFKHALHRYSNFADAKYYSALAHLYTGNMDEAIHLLNSADIEFTFTDANSIYEPYPYQINRFMLRDLKQIVEEEAQ
jgi:tetratricopeptide (TPR) repeat protein